MDSADDALSLRRYGASPGSHRHSHFQILIGLSGALELEIDGRGLRVAAGQGCIIPPSAQHDFESRRGSLCLVLDSAHPDWAHCAPFAAAAPRTSTAHLRPAHDLARYLAHSLHADHASPLARTHGAQLLREAWLSAHAQAHAATPHTGTPAPRPIRAIDWLALEHWAQQHWHRALSVADLAAQTHLSASQFAARCRHEQGQSAIAWLRQLRLAHARQLRGSGMAVAAVAQRTGYQSPSALTAALRRA